MVYIQANLLASVNMSGPNCKAMKYMQANSKVCVIDDAGD